MRAQAEFMTLSEVGRALGVSRSRARTLASEGRIQPAAKTASGTPLYAPQDVARLIKQRSK